MKELPVLAVGPPTREYSSDEEVEVKPVIRSSRPRHKKRADKQRSEPRPSSKERGLLGRFPSLSRSESRGRQSDFDDEDLDDSSNANKYNVDSRSKYSDRLEKTWTPTERPSRREHMRRREVIEKEKEAKEEEAKMRAEKINAASSQPGSARPAPAPGAVKLPQLDAPPQRGQRPVTAPKPIVAAKPVVARPTTVPPAAPQAKPRVPPKETTFGVKETTFGVEEDVVTETSPPRMFFQLLCFEFVLTLTPMCIKHFILCTSVGKKITGESLSWIQPHDLCIARAKGLTTIVFV